MTALVTEVTRTTISSYTYDTLSTSLGVIVIFLLLALLIQKELLRVLGGPLLRVWLQAFNIVVTPLLFAFGLIMAVRFLNLLR